MRSVAGEATALTAYRDLREAIVSGRYQPNERLVEADLARFLGSGRTTVRAALVRLDQEGLVELEANRGARVRLISDREALEIEEVRVSLEGLMARQAAIKLSGDARADLAEMLAEMRVRVAAGDPLGYSELNSRFHQRIWEAADHEVGARLLANLKSQRIRFQYGTILQPGRPEQSLAEHERIVVALVARDPEESEAAMREHLSRVVDTLKLSIARHQGS